MPRAGDRVLIGNTGAYTTCYSGRSAFNGYPAPTVKIPRTAARPAAPRAPATMAARHADLSPAMALAVPDPYHRG